MTTRVLLLLRAVSLIVSLVSACVSPVSADSGDIHRLQEMLATTIADAPSGFRTIIDTTRRAPGFGLSLYPKASWSAHCVCVSESGIQLTPVGATRSAYFRANIGPYPTKQSQFRIFVEKNFASAIPKTYTFWGVLAPQASQPYLVMSWTNAKHTIWVNIMTKGQPEGRTNATLDFEVGLCANPASTPKPLCPQTPNI
jgi:hypothetical protein